MTKTDALPQYLCMDGSATRTADTFYAVYERELSYVWKTLGRLGVEAVELADAVHDVFVIVHRRWADIDFARPIRPWLFGIARRVAAGHRRKRRELPSDTVDGATAPAPHAERDFLWKVLGELDGASPSRDVTFVGALNGIRHRSGNATLARAARQLPLEFWGYDLRGWPPWSPIRRRYRGEAWGLDMFRLLRSSRIVLNRHIGAASHYANNMRLYEATGVGSLLLTDEGSNLAELFEPGREVVTYAGVDDLVEKARHYLAAEDERRTIAAAGQARTLREHTYELRMRELAEILRSHLA